ncbi:MAG: restriction endonuclease, partial [Chloroflexi bacterium]|nr:restriction endonuclease [Chloroflexota bacterium]
DETLIPKDTEERLALARRLVAERCLYGVDKNPMAVEMAKLSLWLITLDKERPFTFLDHALCSGDSLLGVNIKQLTQWSMDTNASNKQQAHQTVWIERPIKYAIDTALSLRCKLRLIPDESIEQIEEKTRLLKEADEAMALVKLGADLLIATTLHGYAKNKHNGKAIPHMEDYAILINAYEDTRPKEKQMTEPDQRFSKEAFDKMRQQVDELLGDRRPFHWPLAYPEVFVEASNEEGFAAMLSNPPFQGGSKITAALGTDYREYLVEYLSQGSRGQVDLCAYFFLRAGSLTRQGGQCCLLATNSIAQGDTRKAGLDQMTAAGWTIPRAVPGRKWPGDAALEVAQVWLRRGDWHGIYFLDEEPVEAITSFLTARGLVQEIAYPLFANMGKSFKGSETAGIGFVLEPEKALGLIKKDARNHDVLFPYLNGDDVNTHPDQSPGRWVINFHNWPLELAETYLDCMRIIQEKVKPERQRKNTKGEYVLRKPLPQRWWMYGEKRPALYTTIAEMKRVLVIPRHSKYMICSWKETGIVFSDATCVVTSESDADFAIIQCTFHSNWTSFHGSTLETRMRYTPTDCFETFPFPANLRNLDNIGERYHQHRQSIMLARQEGLTQTYNRFHNPHEAAEDIVRLRELHREMDEAVAVAYGWDDLALEHGFHETKQGLRYTISEAARREVLARLLKLNHERYAEEVAHGLHDKGAKSKGKNVVAAKKEGKVREARVPYSAAVQGPSLFDSEE